MGAKEIRKGKETFAGLESSIFPRGIDTDDPELAVGISGLLLRIAELEGQLATAFGEIQGLTLRLEVGNTLFFEKVQDTSSPLLNVSLEIEKLDSELQNNTTPFGVAWQKVRAAIFSTIGKVAGITT